MTDTSSVPPVLSLMIGTAGHVDHGKTSLVKRLTGVNTDRHREEQERGMSIDFGVAPFELDDGRLVGIIDVPGHEDFIRNMVSGASSIDVLMLVVAADDAVMPQTVEHMRIVRLLGVTQVIVVITKIDLVDADLLALVKEEIEDFIAQSGFARAPVVSVSNETGEGIGEVKKAICQSIAVAEPSADQRAFRMYVRDVFSVKGYGTIATGVPCAGRIAVGAHLELLPAGRISRVRAIQTYRQDAQETGAHLSSAINLRDLQPLDLSRGMVLGAPGVYRAVSAALVWVKNDCDISRAQRSLKRRAELRFHSGTASTVAALELITGSELDAGEEGFALLRFRQPIVICAGDRFVLRMLSPADTLGGGVVLSANPPKRLRNVVFFADRLRRSLTAVEQGDFLGAELLAGARSVIHEEMLSSLAQTDKQAARALIGAKEKSGEVVMLAEGRWLVRERLEEIVLLLKKLLQRYHRENKYVWGMKPAHVTELLNLPPNSFALLQQLLGGDAEFAVKHGHLALKTFTPAINEREMKLRDAVIERVKKAGAGSVAKGDLQSELGMSAAELKMISKLLTDEGAVRVLGGNYLLASIVEECRTKLLELFEEHQVVGLAAFREKTGLSRNIAVVVLEHFDSEGMTKRHGEGRMLLRKN